MAFKKAVEQVESQQPQENHYQESAEVIGEGLLDTLEESVSNPLGDVISDALIAKALQRVGQNLQSGKTGPLTQSMIGSLSAGLTNPFAKRKAELQTWYKPVALLPSSSESVPL